MMIDAAKRQPDNFFLWMLVFDHAMSAFEKGIAKEAIDKAFLKKVEILSLGAAVILQAKLPNPVWMKGTVGGHFSVLGGLVKIAG